MTRKNYSSFIYAPLSEMSDKEDLSYWRSQSDEAKFIEAWRLVLQACKIKGITEDELRFQRTVAVLQRREG